MNVDRLVEQARERMDDPRWSVCVPHNALDLLAGLADAVEQSREVARNDARALLRWRERASELDARVDALESENAEFRREAGGLTADGRTVPELESRVARLEAFLIDIAEDVPPDIERIIREIMGDSVPSAGQETT